MALHEYECPACGGAMEFNPKSQKGHLSFWDPGLNSIAPPQAGHSYSCRAILSSDSDHHPCLGDPQFVQKLPVFTLPQEQVHPAAGRLDPQLGQKLPVLTLPQEHVQGLPDDWGCI